MFNKETFILIKGRKELQKSSEFDIHLKGMDVELSDLANPTTKHKEFEIFAETSFIPINGDSLKDFIKSGDIVEFKNNNSHLSGVVMYEIKGELIINSEGEIISVPKGTNIEVIDHISRQPQYRTKEINDCFIISYKNKKISNPEIYETDTFEVDCSYCEFKNLFPNEYKENECIKCGRIVLPCIICEKDYCSDCPFLAKPKLEKKQKYVIAVVGEKVTSSAVKTDIISLHTTMHGARLKSIEKEKEGDYDFVYLERKEIQE